MCVILAVMGSEHPTSDLLKACHEQNPHGAGIAWLEGDEVRWRKELKDDQAVRQQIEMRQLKAPYIVHFRIPTVGGNDPRLTHPFPVTEGAELLKRGKAPMVLFHNGTWHKWDDYLVLWALNRDTDVPSGPWSDSRAMAKLAHHTGLNTLELMLGSNPSRIATLDAVNGIQMLGKWEKTPTVGVWASNDNWDREYQKIVNPQPARSSVTITHGTQATTAPAPSTAPAGNPALQIVNLSGGPLDPLDVDSWHNLSDSTRAIVADSVPRSRPLVTKKECLIELCLGTNRAVTGKDFCGKCNTAQAHSIMCHKIPEWQQENAIHPDDVVPDEKTVRDYLMGD